MFCKLVLLVFSLHLSCILIWQLNSANIAWFLDLHYDIKYLFQIACNALCLHPLQDVINTVGGFLSEKMCKCSEFDCMLVKEELELPPP